jgi:hypothetical protein
MSDYRSGVREGLGVLRIEPEMRVFPKALPGVVKCFMINKIK